MNVKLVPRDAHRLCSPLELLSFPIVFGRGEAAGVRLDDRWLSRMHCELRWEDGGVIVRDLQSKHGTFVNGQKISEAPLRAGDELAIGLSKYVAQYSSSPESSDSSRIESFSEAELSAPRDQDGGFAGGVSSVPVLN